MVYCVSQKMQAPQSWNSLTYVRDVLFLAVWHDHIREKYLRKARWFRLAPAWRLKSMEPGSAKRVNTGL